MKIPRASRRPFVPSFDALEPRCQPAFTGRLGGGVLHLDGTDGSDELRIIDNGRGGVRIVGHNNVSRDLTGVRRIELNCRGGNDHISYSLTDPGAVTNSLELSVDLGAGDDSFDATVDLPARDLAAARNFVVTGG